VKTLEQYNKERTGINGDAFDSKPIKNGIECPECESELFDSLPGVILMSAPPKKMVHCNCGFRSYRMA